MQNSAGAIQRPAWSSAPAKETGALSAAAREANGRPDGQGARKQNTKGAEEEERKGWEE